MAAEAGGGEVGRWCVVTGGRGFAARHLVEMLLRTQQWRVKVMDLGPSIKLEPREEEGILGQSFASGDAVYVSADLRNKAQVIKAFEGAEAIFHMAAPDSSINNYQLHYSVNVEGMKNVIDACIDCKVKILICTSSPSVVFDGVHGLFNVDESVPYPEKFNDAYSETKAEGEKLALKANGRNGLLTCCIRPSSIFGPGDRLLVPSLIAAAKAGKSKFIIGDGNNKYDFTYVENVAYAHICAERTLALGGLSAEKAAGQAYFITNMEPIKFWEFMSRILEGLGYERPRMKIPASVIMPIAHLVEWTYKMLAQYGMRVPQLTPSRVRLLSCNRTFNCSKAKSLLGYEPVVSLEDGLKRTVESYPHLRAEEKTRKISKASAYLGNGNIANALLWKDKKQTLTILLLLATIYYYFFTSGFTFIKATAKLLSVVALFLFIHGMLPEKIFSYKIEKISPTYFHLSEEKSQCLAYSVTSLWNSAIGIVRSLCRGKDWPLFLQVFFTLIVLSFLASMSFQSVFKLAIPFLFIAFFIYEKWEDEIDGVVHKIWSRMMKLTANITKKPIKQH